MHVYRWDLDRTYLDTDIHSVRSMIRAAFETAEDKRNIPGSGALMRGLMAADPTSRVSIVSGSPTQLRAVLEQKLALDGVTFDSLTLKDHIGNLRRGRIRAVYGQLGYKLPALLEQRQGLGSTVRETCFGDDTEVDAVVYALYAEVVAGRVDARTMGRVMARGSAYPDAIGLATDALRKLSHMDIVDDIFINIDRGVSVHQFRLLGPRVIPVFTWFQAALVLYSRGRLDASGVADVLDATPHTTEHVASWLQDATRRGLVDADAMMDLFRQTEQLAEHAPGVDRALARLGAFQVPQSAEQPDFLAYLDSL